MRFAGFALVAVAAAVAGCGSKKAAPAPVGNPRGTIEGIFQTRLPASATNAQAVSEQLMTLVFYGRFECSEKDLGTFLKQSKLLPDNLSAGLNPLASIELSAPWWGPKALSTVSGVECRWETGEDVAYCFLAAGRTGDGNAVVYFMVVYENKKQTGLRSEVKADPNWPD
jgi:hypothetical protein